MDIGEEFGNYRVIAVSEKIYTIKLFGIKHPKVFNYLLCECTKCGARRLCRRQFLYNARAHNGTMCAKCTVNAFMFESRTPVKVCPVCCDLGERRSAKTPCKGCGKLFEREVIYREECMINRSPIALAQGMI